MNKFMRILMLCAGSQFVAASVNLATQWERECFQPITASNIHDNYPASHLTFNFGSVTAPPDPLTGVLTGFIQTLQVVHLLESTGDCCDDECGNKKTLYIKFTPEAAVPVFDPTLQYVLVITANNPTVFRELVDLYAIYFRTPQTPLLQITLIPASITNSLVISFAIGYPLADQTLIIDYTTVASASTVLPNIALTGFNATIRSEIIKPDHTYTGTLGLDLLALLTSQHFKNYDDYPERTFLAREELLEAIQSECKRPSTFTDSDLDKIRCYIKKCSLCVRLSKKCIKVGKAGKCQKSKKACILRYFTFVSCCLNALPGLKKKSACDRLQRACGNSDDVHGVFCAIIAILSKTCTSINVDLRVLIEMMFEVIIGYNPYCNLSKTSDAFYGLSEKDAKIVKDYSSKEGSDSAEGGSEQTEDRKPDDDDRRRDGDRSRGSVFYRYRVLIIIGITIVAVGGAVAVYSLM